jgi:microcystin-dependent protein
MPYEVRHINGEVFTEVADQVINQTSSLSFVGKNYTGYGKIIAENFLHLLENFANNTEPNNPVEGQIWYDNADGIQLLKVYDGTKWNPAGSIKKEINAPLAGDSISGDLWVNPNTNQLYMFTGNVWDLIGPQYSSGLKSGPIVDVVTDIVNELHAIVSIYSNNDQLAIFSSTAFTPKQLIVGFEKIKRGINLSTTNITTDLNQLWGTAENANNLIINGKAISSSSFLRSDVESVTSKALSVQTVDGISIGSGLDLKLSTDDRASLINITSKNNRNFKIEFIDPTTKASRTGMFIDSLLKVGINTSTPAATLDVNGSAIVRNDLTIGVVTTDPATTIKGNISANGRLTIGNTVQWSLLKPAITIPETTTPLQPTAIIGGTTLFSDVIHIHHPIGGSVILPKYTQSQLDQNQPFYDIGSSALPFREVYASRFTGTFNGTLTRTISGDVTGSAAKLKNVQTFRIAGDLTSEPVSFNGTSGVIFSTKVSSDIIARRDGTETTAPSDVLLIYRPDVGLKRTTKSVFLSKVPTVPIGAIFPYAGFKPPIGYLFCDGSELLVSEYSELHAIIGQTNAYRPKVSLIGNDTFALPDLRGRFPLGCDSMDNNLTITVNGDEKNAGGNRNGVDANGNPIPGTDPANRVHHSSAIVVGASSGNDTLGVPAYNDIPGLNAASAGAGNASSIMNPYQTINYIIFTGKL